MTPCEVCGRPTAHNIFCVDSVQALVNGTNPHPKHDVCRRCEEALIERNHERQFAYLALFGVCPGAFTDEDRIVLVLGR